MAIAILYRDELKEYDFGPGHPFRGGRYGTFFSFLREHLPEDDTYRVIKAEQATDDDLLLICHREYIDFTTEFYRAAHLGIEAAGPFFHYHSMDNRPAAKSGKVEEAARLVVGQAKRACDMLQSGQFTKAVSIGGGLHHAKPDYGEGFCLYNDVAFCARYLIEHHSLERVLIVDTDAHAGNGTSAYFYDSPKVLFVDLHQDPSTIYPGTGFAHQVGRDEGAGYTVNVPLPLMAGQDSYELIFDEIVDPLAEEFAPQVIIRNGGSDPYFGDGLTNLGLSVTGFRMLGERTAALAERLCDGKVIDLIASGYNEDVLPHAWLSLISGLADIDVSLDDPEPVPARFQKDHSYENTEKVVAEVKSHLKEFWRCFNDA